MRRRRFRRSRTRWAWTGISASANIGPASNALFFVIVDPSSFSTVADITIERVVFDIQWTRVYLDSEPIVQAPLMFAMQLGVVPTDINEDPITDVMVDPTAPSLDATQRHVSMWTKFFTTPPFPNDTVAYASGGTMSSWARGVGATSTANVPYAFEGLMNGAVPYDIKVRRKLNGEQALVLGIFFSANVPADNELQFDLYARALLRVGKK